MTRKTTGFLCPSIILTNTWNPKNRLSELRLQMPQRYIAKELRRYERIRPTTHAITNLSLWRAQNERALPETFEELGEAHFRNQTNEQRMEIIDISAGGMKLRLKDIHTEIETQAYEGRRLFFEGIFTHNSRRPPLNLLLTCRCLQATYNSFLHSLTLRIEFTHLNHMAQNTQILHWGRLKAGAPPIADWIKKYQDSSQHIAEQNNMSTV